MRRLTPATIAAALLLASCGGSSSDTTDDPGSPGSVGASTSSTAPAANSTTAAGSAGGASTTADPGPASGAVFTEPTITGDGVLAFGGPLVGGGSFDAASYEGRPVAFWFWAPG
jgi:hypothetical protein